MTTKPEILFLIPRMSGGGAERVLGVLADGFAAAGWDSSIMLTSQAVEDTVGYPLSSKVQVCSMIGNESKKGFWETLKYSLIQATSSLLGKTCELLNLQVPDIAAYGTFISQYRGKVAYLQHYLHQHPNTSVIAFLQPAVNITLLAKKRLTNKIIISERLDPGRYVLNRYMPYFARKWYPQADCIVFQSEYAQACFPESIKAISSVIFNPLKPGLPEAHTGPRRKVIVNFCRISAQKNLQLLIDAFAELLKKHPDYFLEIIGDGEAKNEIKDYIKQKKLTCQVNLRPFDSNLHESIKDCAMFVSSSDYEGMSNSMLEAMAIGLPVVCTDCPAGGAQAIIEDHINGLLVPVKNKDALCNAMSELIENPDLARKLSSNAVKIKTELNQDKIVDKWLALLECAD